jgi:hypothetical protein
MRLDAVVVGGGNSGYHAEEFVIGTSRRWLERARIKIAERQQATAAADSG